MSPPTRWIARKSDSDSKDQALGFTIGGKGFHVHFSEYRIKAGGLPDSQPYHPATPVFTK